MLYLFRESEDSSSLEIRRDAALNSTDSCAALRTVALKLRTVGY